MARTLPHKFVLGFHRPLLHHRSNNSYPPTNAPPRRGSRTTPPSSYRPLNRRLWTPPRNAHCPSPLRNFNPILRYLANNLLVFIRRPVPNPDPPLLLHARLPVNQSLRNQLLPYALLHRANGIQTSHPSTGLSRGLPHLLNFHKLLDHTHIPTFLPTIPILPHNHWSLRPHRHRRHGLRPLLQQSNNRSIRPLTFRDPRPNILSHWRYNRYLHGAFYSRRSNHPSFPR